MSEEKDPPPIQFDLDSGRFTTPGEKKTNHNDPDTDVRVLNKMRRMLEDGEFDKSITLGKKYLDEKPNAESIWHALAESYYRKKDIENTKRCYLKVIEINPNRESALTQMARILRSEGHIEAAKEFLTKILDINPDNKNALSRIIDIMLAKHDYVGARELLQKVLKINPKNVVAGLLLGKTVIDNIQHLGLETRDLDENSRKLLEQSYDIILAQPLTVKNLRILRQYAMMGINTKNYAVLYNHISGKNLIPELPELNLTINPEQLNKLQLPTIADDGKHSWQIALEGGKEMLNMALNELGKTLWGDQGKRLDIHSPYLYPDPLDKSPFGRGKRGGEVVIKVKDGRTVG